MSIRIVNNIPASEIDAQEQLALDTGATSANRVPESDGEFTLIIAYPDYEKFSNLAARMTPASAPGD